MQKDLQFLLYTTPSEDIKINAVIKDETLWLTQKAMAELFGVNVPAVSKHLANIYEEKELEESATVSKMEIVQIEGARQIKRQTVFYNLDAIISVGYRVNSARATQFRIWATKVLKEYIKKGFVLDDERLKQGTTAFGKDYFRELLERVRSIRASERRIGNRLPIFSKNVALTMTKTPKLPKSSLLRSKTSFIMQLRAKLPQKSSIIRQIVPKSTWDFKRGQEHQINAF